MISHNFNSGTRAFNSNGDSMNNARGHSAPPHVSAPPSPYLEARLLSLEQAHLDLHGEVGDLRDLYHDLRNSFHKDKLRSPLTIACSSQAIDVTVSRQTAMQFKQELEQSSREVRESVNSDAGEQKANGGSTPKTSGSVHPCMRAASVTSHVSGQKSLPPHLRGGRQAGAVNGDAASKPTIDTTKHKHEPLVTDGPVDTIVRQTTIPAAALSPPLSPSTTVQGGAPIPEFEAFALKTWKPFYLTTLASLPANVCAKIPTQQNMITFTFDFLHSTFGGIAWSPGLRYINSTSAPMLKNRTYYMLDPTNEPYLPKAPGQHGAKLTAFFNKAPEEDFNNLSEGTNSYTDVPMFIQVERGQYMYFGNYSQTRWSDKLDNDTMQARVPQYVKKHLAMELAATPREEWVTRELKKHFFPKPEYEGSLLPPTSDDTTITSIDGEQYKKQVTSDIKDYIEELAEWEREANMKTAMMKPDFILNAFDAADADDPPALRLWWEYLECVGWKKDFYNMLVGLQDRFDNPK